MILHFISGKGQGGSKKVFLDYQDAFDEIQIPNYKVVRTNSFVGTELKKKHSDLIEISFIRNLFTQKTLDILKKIACDKKIKLIITHNHQDSALWKKARPDIKILQIIHSNNTKINYADYLIAVNQEISSSITNKPCFYLPNTYKGQCYQYQNNHYNHFGYLGRIRRQKGILLLLQALKELKKTHEQWNITIQGQGYLKPLCLILGYYYNIHKNITWKKWGETNSFFREIDLLIVPSYQETFSLVILEGSMHNKPVVATSTSGPKSILKTCNKEKHLCDISYIALANKLAEYLDNHTNFQAIEPNVITLNFGWEKFKYKLSQILNTLIQ